MMHGKRIAVIMPAYNAQATVAKTFSEIPRDIVDEIVLVDDQSTDRTFEVARSLGMTPIRHTRNTGYGGNQKTCYREALRLGVDVIIMVHPDYQYTPALIPSMASLVAQGVYHCVLGSRILGKQALEGGMPLYKYYFNRVLTFVQNLLVGQKLSEYHTGYRAFAREVLERLPLEDNDNGFLFDNQILAQVIYAGYRIGEVSCPTRYAPDSSSIGLAKSVDYGLGVLRVSAAYRLHRWGLRESALFSPLDRE